MKIIFMSNNLSYNYKNCPRGSVALVHFFKKNNKVLTLNKKNLKYFYFKFLQFLPDIIVTSEVPAGFIPVLLKKIKLIKCPIVHLWDDYYEEQMVNYPKLLIRFLEYFTIKNSDYIITVSKYNQNLSQNLGKTTFYVPHGVDLDKNKSNVNLRKLRTSPKNKIAVYLGEQSTYKKVNEILDATLKLNCDLFLIGEINKDFFKKYNKIKNIHFIGKVPASEILFILKQSDILINTSNQDSNFKFFEYIRAQKPILAYNDKPSYLLTHKHNAYLTSNFKKGLQELLSNDKLRESLIKNIKKIKTYTWKEIAKKHLEIYKKIISYDS